MTDRIDKHEWLGRLDQIAYSPTDEAEQVQFERMGMAGALLQLAKINPEQEYALCRELAEHLLGSVPEPDDDDFDVTGE